MLSMQRRTFIALAATAMMTAGTAGAAAESVKVGILSLGSHAPNLIAEGKGYFGDEGIDVEFVMFQAAQPMAVAIASGDVDFGMTAMTASLVALAERGAVKVIAGGLVEVEGTEGHNILVSKAAYDAGVTTPADLAGKRFGITTAGSSFHYMAHKIADGEGFDRSSYELVTLNGVPAVVASLRSGQIDAWAIQPSISGGMLASGDVVKIGEIGDYVEGYQVTTLFTSSAIAEEKPELVESFLVAFSKGVADYNAAFVDKSASEEESAELVSIIHRHIFTDRTPEEADKAIRDGAMRFSDNGRLSLSNIQDQLDWFKSEGLVPENASIDNLVDTRFVETD